MPNGSYGAMQRGRWGLGLFRRSVSSLGSISAFRKNVLSFYEVDWLSRWLKRLEGRNQRKYKWALQALTCAARCYAAAAARRWWRHLAAQSLTIHRTGSIKVSLHQIPVSKVLLTRGFDAIKSQCTNDCKRNDDAKSFFFLLKLKHDVWKIDIPSTRR